MENGFCIVKSNQIYTRLKSRFVKIGGLILTVMQKRTQVFLLITFLLSSFACDSDMDKAGRFFLKGNEELKDQNYKEAIRLYTESIDKNPLFKEAYNNRGVAYFKTLRYAEAINDYTYAILQVDPDYADAYKNRFEASLASGNFNRALDDSDFLRKAFPDSAYTYFFKGLALTELKRFDEAISEFQKSYELDAENVEAVVNQANAYYMSDRHDEAKELLQKAIGMDASEPNIYNTLSLIATQEGQFEKALDYANQAVELDRLNPYFNNNRGFIYLNLGELEKAEADINLGIKADPRNPWAYRNKAIFYFKSESYDAALRNIEQAALYDESIPLLDYYWGAILLKLDRNAEACEKLSASNTEEAAVLKRQACN
ncbi:MAG: tetratricopeptide (TPR) repeat protein [Roseivirga sp.]|jgi:tetratricopeptide (TPR) repeat protein